MAIALVLDDSMSMRSRTSSGSSRWERAIDGAKELLRSARDGDSVAIVLAGRPARLLLAPTTDLDAVRGAIDDLRVSDRSTDLAGAVQLGRSALQQLPHVDKRILLLSDLAGDDIPQGSPAPWVPLDELREPTSNCGVVQAEQRARRVTVTVACSSALAARGRAVEIVAAEGDSHAPKTTSARPPESGMIASAPLGEQGGTQTLSIDLDRQAEALDARLSESDSIDQDDRAPVAPETTSLLFAVLSDPSTGSVATGGATLLEQALRALETGAQIRPLSLLPDEPNDLRPYAVVLLDDPVGLSPEARAAMKAWLERGGVGAAFVGPAVEAAQLGFTLEPFVTAAVHWETTSAKGIDPASIAWLGKEASSLGALMPRGRAALEGAVPRDGRILARWDDSGPFVVQRELGRGLAFTVGLPSSANQSDFALRPGFLALLQHIVGEATQRRGPRFTPAGMPWIFPGTLPVAISTPDLREVGLDAIPGEPRAFTPTERGRHRVRVGDDVELRVVTIDSDEVTQPPRDVQGIARGAERGGVANQVDGSRELALIVLALFALEGVVRVTTRRGQRRAAIG